MDRPGVPHVPEGSGEPGKMEKTGCNIICGAPMILTAKGIDDDGDDGRGRIILSHLLLFKVNS